MNPRPNPSIATSTKTPAARRTLLVVNVLMGLTSTRLFALLFIPNLAAFGGEAPDAWLGPWVTDGVLGLLIPLAILAAHRLRSARVWACLIMYNTLGAFDYLTGLVTQSLSPLPASIAPPTLVYGSLSFTLIVQIVVIALLFRRSIVDHFTGVA